MTIRPIIAALFLCLTASVSIGQDVPMPAPAPAASTGPLFDTSYRPSASVTARVQREFLQNIRWTAGAETRQALTEAFADKAPSEIWQDLVAVDGLTTNNVTDALASYWVLNWITANAAYTLEIDHAPIQRQLADAFAKDAGFLRISDQRRQELAEGYMLNFLLEHAALNSAVERKDIRALVQLAAASVTRFKRQMGVDLLTLEPGPNGFVPRRAEKN